MFLFLGAGYRAVLHWRKFSELTLYEIFVYIFQLTFLKNGKQAFFKK